MDKLKTYTSISCGVREYPRGTLIEIPELIDRLDKILDDEDNIVYELYELFYELKHHMEGRDL